MQMRHNVLSKIVWHGLGSIMLRFVVGLVAVAAIGLLLCETVDRVRKWLEAPPYP